MVSKREVRRRDVHCKCMRDTPNGVIVRFADFSQMGGKRGRDYRG
jgi:hypothetical protein